MQINIPELSLVVLVGTSSSGKSTFAHKHFKATEIISSDYCRALVSDDENSLHANKDTFELLHYILRKRLKNGLLTVVDATNVQMEARRALVQIAREYHCLPVAVVLNTPLDVCRKRSEERPDRHLPRHVIPNQYRQMKRSLRRLKKEGFRYCFELKKPEEADAAVVTREKLWNNKKELCGPFDLIGDVHGCFKELRKLLAKLGYKVVRHRDRSRNFGYTVKAPEGRKAVFVGDLVDRGPASNEVLRLVMSMTQAGTALCVCGNHDAKLLKKLEGKKVMLNHGLAETMEQLADEPEDFIQATKLFLRGLISHYVLDNGRLVVAHAGLREDMQGRGSGAVRAFCLYGETTGEIDEFGLPVRHNWATEYEGRAQVVFGHTPVPEALWFNKTIDIDTGCVFGGKLTALRYPERVLVDVPAEKVYAAPSRPIGEKVVTSPTDGALNLADVSGKLNITTRLRSNISIQQSRTIAALETMSRFAVDPRWLIYLPPTMSPPATSELPDFLEHPTEAFDYFRKEGIRQVVCQEKHMGSRAIVVIGKDAAAIDRRFGMQNAGIGRIYTRTGRAFFEDKETEQALLEVLSDALETAGFWTDFQTDWAAFDCELMPWSAKARALIKEQYAAVGCAGRIALQHQLEALEKASSRLDVKGLLMQTSEKLLAVQQFGEAYRPYCWKVNGLSDYKLAPFQLLATEGAVHVDKSHLWQMETLHAICAASPQILLATNYRLVDLDDAHTISEATQWWLDRTAAGGEGMVVKPLEAIVKGAKGLIQPAIKCRGKEYLRIIYGPDYDRPDNLEMLKKRGLSAKRALALKEFALGIEALERFIRKDPFRKVHECVFGVLALESEGVDPRL
ncbi:MAG: polynucleotide kinase-phosphatase [Bacteroidota bacterium]